ncbi:hypothetical protein ALC56_11611 [Trachymyrmex septentrionalis]|uniref:Uncharacterized protein n=1 Tax=Trachymyrmex septentrionalis TaxID=34720 RepID=A0A195F150_9HYME|nr:hypothetical protein ALC56_11611 [Trachymyrmex septentrionalis]
MDSHVIDAEAVLPFSRGAKYMDNHPSAVPANTREKKDGEEGTRATGAPNAAKLITSLPPPLSPVPDLLGFANLAVDLEIDTGITRINAPRADGEHRSAPIRGTNDVQHSRAVRNTYQFSSYRL